jgi:hypothetical protein
MNRDSFLSKYKESYLYLCPYFLDPNRWRKIHGVILDALQKQSWSNYIKYLDANGNLSDELNQLPENEGGIYMFFIQGQTLPEFEMYPAYIGRALYTENENIQKRVKCYLRESKGNKRPKIIQLFESWEDFLYIKYFHTSDNNLVETGEKELIRAILPPFNSEIPDRIIIKSPQKAF